MRAVRALRRSPGGTPNAFDRGSSRRWSSASVLNPVNSSMIAVALVPIGGALGAPPRRRPGWSPRLYLATAVGQPVVGRLVDLYGPRRLYLLGTALVGTRRAARRPRPAPWASWSPPGCCSGSAPAPAYPGRDVPDPQRGRRTGQDSPAGVLTALAVASQTVAVVGPTLGGLLIGLGGWRTIFRVNVPLSLACLVLGVAAAAEDADDARQIARAPGERPREPRGPRRASPCSPPCSPR